MNNSDNDEVKDQCEGESDAQSQSESTELDDRNPQSESDEPAGQQEPQLKSKLVDWGITLGVPIVLALFVHAFVLEAFIVPTGSMLNTIQLDDRVWAEKVSYRFASPKPGEVILFNSPTEEGVTLLKRVIATEGQEVDLVDGKVVVDGTPLDEPYVEGKPSYPLDHHAPNIEPISYPYVVPKGHVWLMGDNRTNSLDSRYYGAIPTSSVIGRAFCTYWPLDHARFL